MSQLKACPFCGEVPDLPDGYGTQYEIDCDCGVASSSIQICDLMTLDERCSDPFKDFKYRDEFIDRAKAEAIDQWNRRALPEGYALVPVEPTQKIIRAGGRAVVRHSTQGSYVKPGPDDVRLASSVYRAMLAVAQEVE